MSSLAAQQAEQSVLHFVAAARQRAEREVERDARYKHSLRVPLPGQKRKRDREVRLHGLLPVLARTFYPSWTAAKRRKKSSSSKQLGQRIDAEMSAFVAAGRRLHPRSHPFSVKLFRAFQEHKLQLLATQVPLFDSQQRIITYIDAVGLDYSRSRQQPVPFLCDFKTGYDTGYRQGKQQLQPPFQQQSDSPKNQHHLQLAWELAVCEQPPYCMHFSHAYILLVNAQPKVSKLPLPRWCTPVKRAAMLARLNQ